MSEVRIAAEPRTEFGKGAARRIRRASRVPAVIYGHGTQPRHISLPGHDLMLALKHGGANTLLRVDVQGGTELVLPRGVVRDPIKGHYEHLDLIVVTSGERQTVSVPVTVVGDPPSGGLLDVQHSTVSVEAEVTHIPSEIRVDISQLAVGDKITASELVLPAGTTMSLDGDAIVVQIAAAPTAAEVEADTATPPTLTVPAPSDDAPAEDSDSEG